MNPSDIVQQEEVARQINFEDPQELKEAVRKQIEFYFSQENLAKDKFLTSQMDSQMSVHVSVIAQFSRLKQLTQDTKIIIEAIKQSEQLTLTENDTMVRPNAQQKQRNTIILREIPADVQIDEIRTIFQGIDSEIIDIRSDVGDTWFIVFANEKIAIDVLTQLTSRTFRGSPVKARLKSETALKSFFPIPMAAEMPQNSMPFLMPPAFPPYGFFPYGFMPPVHEPVDRRGGQKYQNDRNSSNQQPAFNKGGRDYPRRNRFNQTESSHSQDIPNNEKSEKEERKDTNSHHHPRNHDIEKSRSTRNNKGHNYQHDTKHNKDQKSVILNSDHFPAFEETHLKAKIQPSQPGYHTPYTSYTQEEILEIVKNMATEEITLPQGLDVDKHFHVLEKEPNKGLLQNQRTFSIDQTREQLCQGRPVLREAVVPGHVDYANLMYGEGYSNSKVNEQKQSEKKQSSHSEFQNKQSIPSKDSTGNKSNDKEGSTKKKKTQKFRKNSNRHVQAQKQSEEKPEVQVKHVIEPKKQEEKSALKDINQSEMKKNEEVAPAKVSGYAAALIRGGLTPNNETKTQSSQLKESTDTTNTPKEEKVSKPKRPKNQGANGDKWQKVENKKPKKKEKFVPKKGVISTAQEDKMNTVEEPRTEKLEVIEDEESKVTTTSAPTSLDSSSSNQHSKRSFLDVVKKTPCGNEKN